MHLTENTVKLIDAMLDHLSDLCRKLEPTKEGYEEVMIQMGITKLKIMSHYSKEDSIHAAKHIAKITSIETDLLNRYRDATAM